LLRRTKEKMETVKRITSHVLRHSFATEGDELLAEARRDFRRRRDAVAPLLGHKDVKTTEIYTHTVKFSNGKGVISPLDELEAKENLMEGV
jgi:site-specific recombinase XerD